MKDFFISYNRADRQWAEWIAFALEEVGYTTVLQAWDFRPGSNSVEKMDQATKETERTLAVLSPDYLTSDFTAPEWQDAFRRDPRGEQGLLVPVRVRETERTGLMASRVYVDLVKLDENAARAALRAGIDQSRAKPSSQPPYPGEPPIPPEVRSVPEPPRFPGSLPPIWNIPHRRNPSFTGRSAILDRLEVAYDADNRAGAAPVVVVLHGLAGVGKTQLTIEYAYRHSVDYDAVWWVRCEEAATLATDFAGLVSALDLPEATATRKADVTAAARRWLERGRQRWLLIFDNSDQPKQLTNYLPATGAGHVLISSRNPVWGRVAQPVPLDGLPTDEAAAFLLRRTGEEEQAEALAEELDGLPLALEQAASFVEETGESLAGYLSMFRVRQAELLEEGAPLPQEYPATVLTTLELAFRRAEGEDAVAADLLKLCAYLASEAIPRDVLSAHADQLPESLRTVLADSFKASKVVGVLRGSSLVEVVDDRTLGVHRLLQVVTRHLLPVEERRQWARVAVNLLAEAFPEEADNVQTWPEASRLLTHALAAAGHASTLQIEDETTGRLLTAVGLHLQGRAVYGRAREVVEQGLAIRERTLPADHPDIAHSLNVLANVLRDQGENPTAAHERAERVLAMRERTLPADHPDTADSLNTLTNVLREQGDLAGARERAERALGIELEAYGPDHPSVASALINLASVWREQGDLAGARERIERTLVIDETVYGPDHPSVATALNNLVHLEERERSQSSVVSRLRRWFWS